MASRGTFDKTVSASSFNLFVLASQLLGDATQWNRIAQTNAVPGALPDFMVFGPITLKVPPVDKTAGNGGILNI
jgi:hypothetical protein